MLFATYGGPPPPPKSNNTALYIFLGVCGGGCLLVILALIGFGFFVNNKVGGLVSGAIEMEKNSPLFITAAVQQKDYDGAVKYVDASASSKLNAETIKQTVEAAEKKLGAFQSMSKASKNSDSNSTTDKQKKTVRLEYIIKYQLTYEKGPATATLLFRSTEVNPEKGDMPTMTGKISGFKIEAGETKDDF